MRVALGITHPDEEERLVVAWDRKDGPQQCLGALLDNG